MTAPYYERLGVTVLHGDCLDVLATLPDASVHAVCTDPPYGIRFMGKAWDGEDIESGVATRRGQAAMPDDGKAGANGGYRSAAAEAGRYDLSANAAFGEWCRQWSAECLRVLKPGGHLVTFGGARTWHRLAAAVEDAGFEIRDSIAWLYASGFPKSLDVRKALMWSGPPCSMCGATGEDRIGGPCRTCRGHKREANPAAEEWQGWGTALKPAFEPIVVARKPLVGTVAGNVLEYGAGALNIDGCRVEWATPTERAETNARCAPNSRWWDTVEKSVALGDKRAHAVVDKTNAAGRWPSNVVLTHAATPDGVDLCIDGCVSGCPVAELDEQAGVRTSGANPTRRGADKFREAYGEFHGQEACTPARGADSGGASRFFPVFRFEAKAPSSERPRVGGVAHPTVKPLALMRWLVRLVTPPGGVVLDPFLGSGTTAQAARAEGFRCVGIEREESYLPLIKSRLDGDAPDLFGGVA